MNMKKGKRVLAVVMAFLMVFGITPVDWVSLLGTKTVKAAGSTYVFESKDLTAAPDKKTFTDGQEVAAGTDNYFTLVMSANTKIDSSSKTFADDYQSDQRLNFGGKADIENNKNFVKFTTDGAATVKVWFTEGGDDNRQMAIYGTDGTVKAQTSGAYIKNSPYVEELSLADAGTYMLGGLENNNYIYKIVVTEEGGAAPAARKAWSEVATPSIALVEQATDGNVNVEYNGVIGKNGADKVELIVINDADGSIVKTITSLTEGNGAAKTFTLDDSGSYSVTPVASRADEEEVHAGLASSFNFTLPLAKPVISGGASLGGGSEKITWEAVKEATSYNVVANGEVKVENTTDTEATITGLEVGRTYDFVVEAIRGEEKTISDGFTATVTADAQTLWNYIVYGNGANSSNADYEGSANDGSVTLRSGAQDADGKITGKKNNGKLVPASFDGVNFYYTTVPTSQNFTLRAKVTVDSWFLSNGQEGFGLLATDRIGGSGWNNSYFAEATKTEYFAETDENGDPISESVTTSTDGTFKVSQKIGINSLEKAGLTADNIGAVEANDSSVVAPITAKYKATPLETRFPSSTNIIGNGVNSNADPAFTEFYLTIQKNNTGYFVTYEAADGSYSNTKKYYDPAALDALDADNNYVGFFTSRYAKATFSDISFSTINAADDAPAEERPIEYTAVNTTVESPSATGVQNYDLIFSANADGVASVEDANGNVLASDIAVSAKTSTTLLNTDLVKGSNNFNIIFTPAEGYQPNGEYSAMESYDPVTVEFKVTYKTIGQPGQSIWVKPEATGSGSHEDPTDFKTAIKYVQPGQTIVMMEGTYVYEEGLKVARGVNGTEDANIVLMADPDASSKPVIDFNSIGSGIIFGGDYWYIQGIDVTRSANAMKGIQVSGKHITLDQVDAYHNGNTGIQVSRLNSTDEFDMWPSDNLILNCTSYGNADAGYEDADGFAAKLTVGNNVVFDGCISHHNADDGWDLFAKVQTGSIGAVTIKNCVAYKNGYLEDGTDAGNGNGFKMGGDSMSGKHLLQNSVAYDNKAKGIDSNSCPDINVKQSTTFNNESFNVAFYTNTAKETAFTADGIISYRKGVSETTAEQFKLLGSQDKTLVYSANNYYWGNKPDKATLLKADEPTAAMASYNLDGVQVTDDWFVSLDTSVAPTRDANGIIDMHGLLVLTDKAPATAGARISDGQTASLKLLVPPSVPTGDTTNMMLYVVLMAMAAAGIAVVVISKKKRA